MQDIVGALSFKLECFSLAVLSLPGHVQAKGKPSLSDMKFSQRVGLAKAIANCTYLVSIGS